MNCKICTQPVSFEFNAKLLNKYQVDFFYCKSCGFLQTKEPYWLDKAYSIAIAAVDTGLVQRNLALSKILSPMLFFLFDRCGRYLDVAGGCGMLTRLMRDIGFDFYWSDKYCENLLARGFEVPANLNFVAVTAFEVMEHLPDPLGFIAESLTQAKTQTMIFSTELFEGTPPKPGSWWYYTFETGQHVSFYQRRTLQVMAEKLSLNCYSSGSIHLLTDKKINPLVYRCLTHPNTRFLSCVPKSFLKSKTMSDHLEMARGYTSGRPATGSDGL